MRPLIDFWASQFWGWGFGQFGSRYTIVYQRHIGLDMARRGDVPVLWSGTVVRVVKTQAMSWVVVIDTGLPGNRRFHSYCHLAYDRLPRVGVRLERGERVGRVALGARSSNDPDWGGTAWDGPHLHYVVGGHPDSAYLMVWGHRSLSAFTDPTVVIRDALATPSGGKLRPFPGGKDGTTFDSEEDDMAYIANVKNGNFYLVTGTKAHKLGAASNARRSKMPIIDYPDDWAVQQLKSVVTGID